jgi:hypothetical protein
MSQVWLTGRVAGRRSGRSDGTYPPLDEAAYKAIPILEKRAKTFGPMLLDRAQREWSRTLRGRGRDDLKWPETIDDAIVLLANQAIHPPFDEQTNAREAILELRQEIAEGKIDTGRDADSDLRILLIFTQTMDKLHDYSLRGRQRQLFHGAHPERRLSPGELEAVVRRQRLIQIDQQARRNMGLEHARMRAEEGDARRSAAAVVKRSQKAAATRASGGKPKAAAGLSPRTAEVRTGDVFWTLVGTDLVKVEIVGETKSPRSGRTEFRVRRVDNGVYLPKNRSAASLRVRPEKHY